MKDLKLNWPAMAKTNKVKNLKKTNKRDCGKWREKKTKKTTRIFRLYTDKAS
jgi:hypothetical protein